jgi:hypothetical protein
MFKKIIAGMALVTSIGFTFPAHAQTDSQASLIQTSPLQLRLISSPFTATVGVEFTALFQAAGGAGSITLQVDGVMPPGLVFSQRTLSCEGVSADQCALSAMAELKGVPTQAGNFTFTVIATDSKSSSIKNLFTLTVKASASQAGGISMTTDSALVGLVYSAFTPSLIKASGGAEPYTWEIVSGSLPKGLFLTEPPVPLVASCPLPACGNFKRDGILIQGTPEEKGQFSFLLQATDSQKMIGQQGFVVTILDAAETEGLDFTLGDQSSAGGSLISIPEGTSFKLANNPTVYYMSQNGKQAYTSFEMLQLWKVAVSDIVILDTTILPPDDPNGAFVRFPEGVLIKSKISPAVYGMKDGYLHPFSSMSALRRGRTVIKITTVPQGDIDFHKPFGEPIN